MPEGKDENSNLEIEKSGEIKNFDFKPKSHIDLGDNLKMLDFDLASKTSGSRFVFVTKKLAMLERALSNFMIDTHVNKNNYLEISPPLIANENTMYGTGQLPKFENDQFELMLEDKNDRKNKIIELQHGISLEKNESFIGKTMKVIVDQAENNIGVGRTEFDSPEIDNIVRIDGKVSKGDFVKVKIENNRKEKNEKESDRR